MKGIAAMTGKTRCATNCCWSNVRGISRCKRTESKSQDSSQRHLANRYQQEDHNISLLVVPFHKSQPRTPRFSCLTPCAGKQHFYSVCVSGYLSIGQVQQNFTLDSWARRSPRSRRWSRAPSRALLLWTSPPARRCAERKQCKYIYYAITFHITATVLFYMVTLAVQYCTGSRDSLAAAYQPTNNGACPYPT